MRTPARHLLIGLASVALLAGCSGGDKQASETPDEDSALSGALGDQIMVDPELAGQSGANAGASAGMSKIELPPEQRSPEAIAAAKAEAAKLAGGAIKPAPALAGGDVSALVENAATAAQLARAAGAQPVDCSDKVEYSAKWATALPKPLAVYPRGAVQEAAGTDSANCSLRVVSFATPVAPRDVIDFYYTQVRAGGYDAKYQMDGKDHVLGGSKGKAAYLIYARSLENGVTEVDLVASGR